MSGFHCVTAGCTRLVVSGSRCDACRAAYRPKDMPDARQPVDPMIAAAGAVGAHIRTLAAEITTLRLRAEHAEARVAELEQQAAEHAADRRFA